MKKAILTFSFLILASVGFAQTDSHTQAVNELMEVMNMKQQMEESAERMFELQARQMPQIAQYKEIMLEFFNKYINWETIGEDVKQVYKNSFTEAEIRDLIAFFKTDTGQKFTTQNPEINQKIAEISQNIVMQHQTELQNRIMQAVQNQQGQQ